jgi:DnaJ-class molecular chaperone
MVDNNCQGRAAAPKLNPGDEALPGTPGTGEDICPNCAGRGRIDDRSCPNCGGTGKIIKGIGGA